MSYIDPTKVRLSRHFLLSDFIGCHSVYTHGYRNTFFEDEDKLAEGEALAVRLLEPLTCYGVSICYGYISPDLSRKIVSYQDPDKPSYHRWDAGAACDILLHAYDHLGTPPIFQAETIDKHLKASRIITYSESPWICVATKVEELEACKPRRALYENRYVGERKPKFIRYSMNFKTRAEQLANIELEYDWLGAGYPTYHCGGGRKLEHYRTSRKTMLTDWLYSHTATTKGYKNAPSLRNLWKFKEAGRIYDAILDTVKVRRMSIVRAYESPSWASSPYTWEDGICMNLVPPEHVSAEYVAEQIEAHLSGPRFPTVSSVSTKAGAVIVRALFPKAQGRARTKRVRRVRSSSA